MKTAMQELIEWVDNYPTEVLTIHKSAVKEKAKSLLEKEKEQMIQCHYDGQRLHSKSITQSMLMDNCESYWEETFKTNEK